MDVTIDISELPIGTNFIAPSSEIKKMDSSYKSDPDAIGNLRWEGVANGRYEDYHPIWSKDESIIGHLIHGLSSLGYTYDCLYNDRTGYFFVSHIPFRMTWDKKLKQEEKASFISIVEPVGKFWSTKKGLKYSMTKSLAFHYDWVDAALIYRLINNESSLLCVTRMGFCLIDVFHVSITYKVMAEGYRGLTGTALSPNGRLLAVTMSEWYYNDPIKGEEIYKTTLKIYDVIHGKMLGEKDTGLKKYHYDCKIDFNDEGDMIRLVSQDFNKLETKI